MKHKTPIKYSNNRCIGFLYIIQIWLSRIDYFLYRALRVQIESFYYSIFVWYFWVSRGNYFIFLEHFVLVARLFDNPDVFNYVLSELWPLQMSITIDINGLKKLYQVRNEKILWELLIRDVEFFNQVDEGRQLKTLWVELKLFF